MVIFNGTNAVKEELHWWSDALLARGVATITLDGPGLGETFHRLDLRRRAAAGRGRDREPHRDRIPELDPDAVGFMGLSLGGYCAIRMAAHDSRVRAVAAVSPPFSADVYWNVTLFAMRRELAALYDMPIEEMDRHIPRITLADALPTLDRPLMVAGGGHDMITPGEEAYRIFETRALRARAGLLSARRARLLQRARRPAAAHGRLARAPDHPSPHRPRDAAAAARRRRRAIPRGSPARPWTPISPTNCAAIRIRWSGTRRSSAPAWGRQFRWPWFPDRHPQVVHKAAWPEVHPVTPTPAP